VPIDRDAITPQAAWVRIVLSIPIVILGILSVGGASEWWEFALPAVLVALAVTLLVVGIRNFKKPTHLG
jgi:hypothetical protein